MRRPAGQLQKGSAKVCVRVVKTADKREKVLKCAITVTEDKVKLASVTQNKANKLTAVLSKAAEKVSASDFAIVRDGDNTVIPVKSAALDATDKTKVTIETYAGMTDGKGYTVTYTAPTEDKTVSTAQFTATDGKVVDVALSTSNVTAGVAEDVKVQTIGTNNVILNEYGYTACSKNNIEMTVTPATQGYMDGDKLYLPEVGNTAAVKVVYHTYKYENGAEVGVITKDFTVTAVKDAATMSNWGYTIISAAKGTEKPAWNSATFKANTQIAIKETTAQKVFFLFKDSKGNNKTNAGYKVASSDASKMIVEEASITDDQTGLSIVGVSEGTAYILVKDKDNNVVTTLPVTVVAEKKAAMLTLDAASIKLSTAITDKKTVKFTVKDQYGNKIDAASEYTPTVELLTGPSGKDKVITTSCVPTKGAIDFVGADYKDANGEYITGNYVYKVSVTYNNKTVSNTVTVNVATPSGNISNYAIELDGADANNAVDLATGDKAEGKKLTVKVAELKNGVVSGYVDASDIVLDVKAADGTKFNHVANNEVELSRVTGGSLNAIEKLAKKDTTYSITVNATVDADGKEGTTDTKVIKLTTSFNVKDTQINPVIEVKDTDAANTSLTSVFTNTDKVKFSLDGADCTPTIEDFDCVFASSNGTYTVKSVKVMFETVKGVNVYADITVNRQFTNVSGK